MLIPFRKAVFSVTNLQPYTDVMILHSYHDSQNFYLRPWRNEDATLIIVIFLDGGQFYDRNNYRNRMEINSLLNLCMVYSGLESKARKVFYFILMTSRCRIDPFIIFFKSFVHFSFKCHGERSQSERFLRIWSFPSGQFKKKKKKFPLYVWPSPQTLSLTLSVLEWDNEYCQILLKSMDHYVPSVMCQNQPFDIYRLCIL